MFKRTSLPFAFLCLCLLATAITCYAQPENLIQQFEEELANATPRRKADILYALITHHVGNNVKKAQALTDEIIFLGRKEANNEILVIGLVEKANILRRRSKRDSAMMLFSEAQRLRPKVEDLTVLGLLDLRLGLYHNGSDNDSAIWYLKQAGEHFVKADAPSSQALAIAYIGNVLQTTGSMDSAQLFLDSAASIAMSVVEYDSSYWPSRNAAAIANFQGILYTRKGKYEDGLRWNLRSLRYFERVGDLLSIGSALHSTGTTYRMLLKPEAAIEHFRRALVKFKEADNLFGIGASYESIALAYDDKESFDSSLFYFNRALDISRETKNQATEANIYNNLGALYYSMKDYSRAGEYYEKSFVLRGGFEKSKPHEFATAMINLGQVAVETGDLVKARDYLMRGLQKAREIRFPDYEKSALEGLVDYYKLKNDYKSALAYQDSLNVVKDSLYVVDNKSKIAEMEVQYKTEKHKQEIELLKTNQRLAEFRNALWMGGLLTAIIIAGLLVYILQTRKVRILAELDLARKEKQLVQNELNYKDKELVHFATLITEKDELLQNVFETINNADVSKSEGREQLESILPSIRENINLSGNREEFNVRLESIYGGFIQRVEEKYPSLTDHEKRLATLVRVNLSSKQIASVFNISAKSVDMSRYRLRKKMGLQGEQDLHNVLTTI